VILRDLRRSEVKAYEDALAGNAISMRLHVTLRNADEKPIGSLTADGDWERALTRGIPGVIDAQVDVDSAADVTHQFRCTVTDPLGQLVFDKDNPGKGLFPDRLVSAEHSLWVEDLDDWIDAPVFWGPISRFERTGHEVSIEAWGKESLALAPNLLWKTMKLNDGDKVVDAIKKLLKAKGERRFDFPDFERKLSKDIWLGPRTEPWKRAKRMAASCNAQLFYGGDGYCRMRKWPDDPVAVLTDGYRDHLDHQSG